MNKHINIPVCEDPVLIINPRALYLLQHDGAVVSFMNVQGRFEGSSINKLPRRMMLREAYKLVGNNHNYAALEPYVVRSENREEFLFMVVPCNKCDLCGYRKQIDMVQRAALDESLFDCPPIWFTLTYKPACLPANGELRYKDVQDFFKRLRRKLDRLHLPTDFRYICAGEYGKLGRPHYHVIMYNNPFRCDETQTKKFAALEKLIFDAWGMSEPQARDFHQCYGATSAYVTKYLCKSFRFTNHVYKPFVHCSLKNGGLGRRRLETKKDFYRNNLAQPSFDYRDRKGSVKTVNFSSYLDLVLYPSVSQLVPSSQRVLYREYIYTLQQAVRLGVLLNEDAYKMAEENRPYKNAIRNSYEDVACVRLSDEGDYFDPGLYDCDCRDYVLRTFPKAVGNIVQILDHIAADLDSDVLIDAKDIEIYEKFHDLHQFEPQTFEQKVNRAHRAKKQKAVAQFNEKL